MQQILEAAGQYAPKAQPILELNSAHKLVTRLKDINDDDSFNDWVSLLFEQAQLAAGNQIPAGGRMFISVRDEDQKSVIDVARYFSENGFELLATRGTAKVIEAAGIKVRQVNKLSEGRPNIVDMIVNDDIDIIINTHSDKQSREDAYVIRREALVHHVTNYTTLAAARAACEGHRQASDFSVNRLQELHQEITQ